METTPTGCQVRLGGFEGPLDLLLHLVRSQQLDITDLPIVEITRQYQDYLELMRELSLEVAGEYLVMAATLVHIKSRMLLPQEPAPGDEEAPVEDPRAELVHQLLEHQRFKQAADTLGALESVQSLVWTREGVVPAEFAGEHLLVADMFDLLSAFRKLVGRLDDEARLRLGREDVSVADTIGWLTDLLEATPSLSLEEVLLPLQSRMERIATFLAVLEMMRLQILLAFQVLPLGEIRLTRRPTPPGDVQQEERA